MSRYTNDRKPFHAIELDPKMTEYSAELLVKCLASADGGISRKLESMISFDLI